MVFKEVQKTDDAFKAIGPIAEKPEKEIGVTTTGHIKVEIIRKEVYNYDVVKKGQTAQLKEAKVIDYVPTNARPLNDERRKNLSSLLNKTLICEKKTVEISGDVVIVTRDKVIVLSGGTYAPSESKTNYLKMADADKNVKGYAAEKIQIYDKKTGMLEEEITDGFVKFIIGPTGGKYEIYKSAEFSMGNPDQKLIVNGKNFNTDDFKNWVKTDGKRDENNKAIVINKLGCGGSHFENAVIMKNITKDGYDYYLVVKNKETENIEMQPLLIAPVDVYKSYNAATGKDMLTKKCTIVVNTWYIVDMEDKKTGTS